MTSLFTHSGLEDCVGQTFAELSVLQQLAALPADSILRILQSIPPDLLREALPAAGDRLETAAPPPGGQERRDGPRLRTLRAARLILHGRRSTLDVELRDLSEEGCRIWTPTAALLPVRLAIQLEGMESTLDCELCWREGSEAGLRFLFG